MSCIHKVQYRLFRMSSTFFTYFFLAFFGCILSITWKAALRWFHTLKHARQYGDHPLYFFMLWIVSFMAKELWIFVYRVHGFVWKNSAILLTIWVKSIICFPCIFEYFHYFTTPNLPNNCAIFRKLIGFFFAIFIWIVK